MDNGRLVIARVFGVPVDVTPMWFLVAGLVAYGFADTVEHAVPSVGPWKYAVSTGFALLLYLSVFLHELSHTVVALRAGLPVRRISLHLLGGYSEISQPAPTPAREAGIAVAGPLASLALAALGYALMQPLEPGTVSHLLARAFVVTNLIVAVFNLLPGLPLDGGRVLAATVWRVSGRRHTGSLVAGWGGRVVAVAVLAISLLPLRSEGSSPIALLWGMLIAAFLWSGATQAIRHAGVSARLPVLHARTLTRRAIPVEATLPLAEALRRAGEAGAGGLVVVSAGGDPLGLVHEAAVRHVPVERRPWIPVSDLSRRLEDGHRIRADLSGQALVEALSAHPAPEYLVVEDDGSIYGILATADVERVLRDGPVRTG